MDNQLLNKILAKMASKIASAEMQLAIAETNAETMQEKITGLEQELAKYKKGDKKNGKDN